MGNYSINEAKLVIKDQISKDDTFETSNVVVTILPNNVSREWVEAIGALKSKVSKLFILVPNGSFIVYSGGQLVEDGGAGEWQQYIE